MAQRLVRNPDTLEQAIACVGSEFDPDRYECVAYWQPTLFGGPDDVMVYVTRRNDDQNH